VPAACRKAFSETLPAGLPVFYLDAAGINVMERADGRRFEIHWLPGAPSGKNYVANAGTVVWQAEPLPEWFKL
jgi:hypothetical protein